MPSLQSVSLTVQDVLAHRALEFLDDGGFEAGEIGLCDCQPVRFQVGLVLQADEVRDEAQAALALL